MIFQWSIDERMYKANMTPHGSISNKECIIQMLHIYKNKKKKIICEYISLSIGDYYAMLVTGYQLTIS